MRSENSSGAVDDYVWGVNHDVFDNPFGAAMSRLFEIGEADSEVIRIMRNSVASVKRKEQTGKLEPFRKPRLHSGDLLLGSDRDGDQVLIDSHSLNTSVLMVGNPGSTKTNWLKLQILQLAGGIKGLWLTDLYKKELRHLKPLLARKGVELIVLSAAQMRINPLQEDRCDPRGYLPVAVDLIARAIDVPPRARTILNRSCYALYERFGVLRGQTQEWPTLFDVFEHIRASHGLNAQARESLLDRLGALLVSLGPQCLGYRQAWNPSDLAQHAIVSELRGTSEAAKSLLVGYTLQATLHSRVEQGRVNPQMDLFVCFEDCQRFFSADESGVGMSSMDELSGLMRGTGTGLGGLAQSLRGLSRAYISNSSTKIMGRLGSHADYAALGADMGMSREQIEWAKLNLGPGLFICQVAEGAWRRPFTLRVPRLNVPSVVSDEEAARSVSPLLALPAKRATEFDGWQPYASIKVTAGEPISAQNTQPDTAVALNEADLRFLRAVIDTPGLRTVDLAKQLKMSTRRVIAIRKKLVQEGYVREHRVAVRGRGRPGVILEPLESAHKAAQSGGAS